MSGNNMKCNAGGGALYGIGIFGALIYFMQTATSFAAVLIGIVKAIFWPAVIGWTLLGVLIMTLCIRIQKIKMNFEL